MGLAALLASGTRAAYAHDAYDDSQSHPLRIAAYGLHPIGWAIEWLALRPMHFVVSQPQLEPIFGHTPHESPFGDYSPYEPDDQ
jgi:hypothetical protein